MYAYSGTCSDRASAFCVVGSACDRLVPSPYSAFSAATQAAAVSQSVAPSDSDNTTTTAALISSSLSSSTLLYNQLMCLPGILDNIRPQIRKDSMTTTQFKPIPNAERYENRLSQPAGTL